MHNTVLAMLECGPLTSVSAYILSRSKCALSASDQSVSNSKPVRTVIPLLARTKMALRAHCFGPNSNVCQCKLSASEQVQIQTEVGTDYLVPDQSRFK